MDISQMVVAWRCLARDLAISSAASSRTRTSVYARDHTRPPTVVGGGYCRISRFMEVCRLEWP